MGAAVGVDENIEPSQLPPELDEDEEDNDEAEFLGGGDNEERHPLLES